MSKWSPVCVAALALLVTASAGASQHLTLYPVPTGGFAVGLPPTWMDMTKAATASPSPGTDNTQSTSSTEGLRLFAADPARKGSVYMDAGVARVGTAAAAAVARDSLVQLTAQVGKKGTVSMTAVKLRAGAAYRIRIHFTDAKAGPESLQYVLVHDQVEYAIAYVAPNATWAKYEAMFEQSARSFRFLASRDLSSTVLSAAQVGAGYKREAYPTGNSFIGTTTLDLCAASYPSELLRTGRLQVRYVHPGKSVVVSNEVVTYAAGGAKQALSEVTAVAAACAKKPVVRKQGNLTLTYSVTPVTGASLAPGTVAVRVTKHATDGKHTVTETGIAIYQVKGDTFSGVYTFVTAGTTIAQATQVAFHAAQQSADVLAGLTFSA